MAKKKTISKCPVCGEELEATVKVYLSGVEITDGHVTSASFASFYGRGDHIKSLSFLSPEDLALDCNEEELDLYCPNDHNLVFDENDKLVENVGGSR